MAYIKDEEINDIRSHADIVDIISDYLPVTQKGKNFVTVCPFHDDHSPSLVISRERQIFNCFTCRTGGNVFSFIMKYENVGFLEAVKTVANKIGYNLKLDNFTDFTDSKYKEDYEIMDFASKYYMNNIMTTSGENARKYLSNRGITEEIIKEFNIGFAGTAPDTLYKLSTNKGWNIDKLNDLGLINKVGINVYDTFTNRVMVPIENLKGQVVGFTGRIFNGETDTAKYINTKETNIFKKSHILFNYHNARNYIREQKEVVVVEGNMDAITLSASGIKNVVALMGVALSREQMDTLKRLKVPVILMLDNDNAGLDATVKNGEAMINFGIDTKVVRLSGAKDPDEYIRANGVDALKDNIKHAVKYIDFKLEYLKRNKNLDNMEDIISYVKEVINSLNNQDDLTKELVISKISKDYAIDAEILKKGITSVPIKKEKEIVRENPTKLSKYQKASHKVLYYMLMDNKFISIYKNKLGYLKERMERVLASEIVYYSSNNGGIDIADFTTYIMNNPECFAFLEIILGENSATEVDDKEFDVCIDAILKIYKNDEIEELKLKIKNEMDVSKKLELMTKLTEIKKEV